MRPDHSKGLEWKIIDLFFLPLTEYKIQNDEEGIDSYNEIYLYGETEEIRYMKKNGLYIICERGGL